jgi:pimeloyl-ACP methyl ester carboxylesterase
MSSKPTLVLVPGAWHTPEAWNKVTSLLEAKDYKCIPVILPSTLSNPSTTFFDDIEAVRDAILSETRQGRNVVVVVHSYGGAVGCSAVKGTSSSSETSGRVIGIASMASGFGPSGVSFIDGLGGSPPPSWKVDEESGFAVLVAEPRELFYHDLPVEEGEYWVGKLTKQASRPLMHKEGGEHAYAGWMDIPAWYLATSQDAGGDITVREVESSHSPMLSKPEETAKFIEEAVAAFVG